ncbi:hypothetical protein EW146_g6155 [Bondarzewia mesenterica]|uniref:Uncharacterized protein n=1 Tax=Bondarzewia mesenterica TaxID=1095465 RepID=A0A4S4LPD0_9AGAM|nr:hypothetical protein EW146_g6155 [Bondarzewia mesenterica]
MDHLDTSWCPVCGRHILPKRYTVPVQPSKPPQPTIPAPPPSSPTSPSPSKNNAQDAPTIRRTRSKNGTIRARTAGGLTRGTGRVKPNGTIKRSDSKKNPPAPTSPPAPQQPPTAPVKHRTVIDQNPTPLYCSDECRLADLNNIHTGLPINYHPDRDGCDSPTLPPVPHNSLTNIVSPLSSETETDSASSASTSPESEDKVLVGDSAPLSGYASISPSVAALARMYDFPPLPPPAPLLEEEQETSSFPEPPNDYQSGVMMAARRIKAALCPEPAPKRSSYPFNQAPSRDRKPIPGWTDGSDAWRSSVYSLSTVETAMKQASGVQDRPSAYKSFAASPHRSIGVYSTLGEDPTPTASHSSAASTSTSKLTSAARSSTQEDVSSKYPLTFARRSDSHQSLSGSPHAQSLPANSRRREHSILKPGAEGMLLVPDVKLRSPSAASSYSNDTPSLSSWRSGSTRSLARSPLSRRGSELSEDSISESPELGEVGSLPTPKRRGVETRSWSYDNVLTYPIMPMPKRKEIRFEKHVVNGETKIVEVEVEVQPQMKRLFLFPGKEVRR